MHFGLPVLAFDCVFNRFTTDDAALYFKDAEALAARLQSLGPKAASRIGGAMAELANSRYTWARIGDEYFSLMESAPDPVRERRFT